MSRSRRNLLVVATNIGFLVGICACGDDNGAAVCAKAQDWFDRCQKATASKPFNKEACETAMDQCTKDDQDKYQQEIECVANATTCSDGNITSGDPVTCVPSNVQLTTSMTAECKTALEIAGNQ